MKKKAFAKLNLSLDVLRKRDDGYHEMEMVMVPIDLFDTVEIKISEKMELRSNKSYLPIDNRNTIIKTINLLRNKYGFKEQFSIRLQKNIPTQGGMGGGSADAAVTIKIIDELLDLKMNQKTKYQIAKEVGADVPFCLFGKPAVVKGIGEHIEPLKFNLDFYLFIVKPFKGVSTPESFKLLDFLHVEHPNTEKVIEALEEDNYQNFIDNIGNTLEYSALQLVDEISELKTELIEFGFDTALMSGAGSTVFGITQDEALVDRAVTHFVDNYALVKKTKVVDDVSMYENIKNYF